MVKLPALKRSYRSASGPLSKADKRTLREFYKNFKNESDDELSRKRGIYRNRGLLNQMQPLDEERREILAWIIQHRTKKRRMSAWLIPIATAAVGAGIALLVQHWAKIEAFFWEASTK